MLLSLQICDYCTLLCNYLPRFLQHPFGLHNVLRMGEGQSKSEYNHDGRQKSENSHRRSHGDNTIEVPAFGTVPVRPAPPPPDAAPVERKMSAVVLQMNPVYRDVPFRLAPLLEMRSQCSELDNLCSRLKDQLRTSPMDIQYDFVLEKSVARDSG